MAAETFKVVNNGTLALKYQLALSTDKANEVVEDGEGTGKTLADVLKVAVIENPEKDKYETRDEALEALEKEKVSLKDYVDNDLVKNGRLVPTDKTAEGFTTEDTFAVILYWEPNVKTDNDYNLNNGKTASQVDLEAAEGEEVPDTTKHLFIDFGVNLVATQVPYEEDSFDENYDASAAFPDDGVKASGKATVYGRNEFTLEKAPADGKETTVLIPSGSFPYTEVEDNDEVVVTLNVKNVIQKVGENKEKISILDIVITVNGKEIHNLQTGNPAQVTTYIEPGLHGVEVRSAEDGKQLQASYDKESGKLTFKTPHFSKFEIYKLTGTDAEKDDEGYSFRVGEGDAAQYQKDNGSGPISNAPKDGSTLYLTGDYTYGDGTKNMSGAVANAKRVVDLNGHMLTAGYASLNTIGGTGTWEFTLKNGTFASTSSGSYGLHVGKASTILFEDLLIDRPNGNSKKYNYCGSMSLSGNNITLNRVNAANGASCIYNDANGSVTLKDSEFHWNNKSDKALYLNGDPASTLSMDGCTVDGNAELGMTGEVTIKDTKFDGDLVLRKTGSKSTDPRMEATLEGCTITGVMMIGDNAYSNAFVNVTLKDVTITGSVKISTKKTSKVSDAKFTIVSGTYSFDPNNTDGVSLAEGSTVSEQNGKWIVKAQ